MQVVKIIFGFIFSFVVSYQLSAQSSKKYNFNILYTKIFDVNCYSAGCHDGTFEPNFTSMNNAYYTLVLHPVKKNDEIGSFTYRVAPGNSKESLLFERITNCCFLDIDDRMPLLSKYLSKKEIRLIKKWIEAGAPDWKGNVPVLEN
jgi:hypothetical protein